MFSQHPEIAKEFAAATPSVKALPDKVKTSATEKTRPMDLHEAKKRHK